MGYYVPCVLMFKTDYISDDSAVTAAKAGLSSGLHSGSGTYNAHCLYSSSRRPIALLCFDTSFAKRIVNTAREVSYQYQY